MHAVSGGWGWLEETALAQAMRSWLWLYPIVEIIHIVGFVVVVGAVVMFDLRILGLSRTIPVRALGHHLLRWSVAGLIFVVPAGLMMFTAHPQEFATSNVFLLKMALIGVAGINAAMFHTGVYRSAARWDTGTAAPAIAKMHALLSIAIWIAVISCGRLLAYT
jgi:hypothetical protein